MLQLYHDEHKLVFHEMLLFTILFVDSWLSFLAIVMSVLRFIDSDCPLVCPNSSYEIWFDTMGTEPMVSCTLVECSYLYPHKDDVRFTFTPSCFGKQGGGVIFIYVTCIYLYRLPPTRFPYHMMFESCNSNTTDATGTAYIYGAHESIPGFMWIVSRSLLDLFDIVVYDLLYTW